MGAGVDKRQDAAPKGNSHGFVRLKLTPSDQLLSIALVNFIFLGATWLVLEEGYGSGRPSLPTWVLASAIITLLGPFALATADSWLSGLAHLIIGDSGHNSNLSITQNVLKPAVFAFTAITIVVLWQITNRTAGVAGPFVPFLTAPAVFSPFVARKWLPIAVLSVAVAGCIGLLSPQANSDLALPAEWTYKVIAAMMIVIAGALTAVRLRIETKGAPITGPGSASPEPEGSRIETKGASITGPGSASPEPEG